MADEFIIILEITKKIKTHEIEDRDNQNKAQNKKNDF